MNIENEIFKRSRANFNKLVNYGFIKSKDIYVFKKVFLNKEFKAIIKVDKEERVFGKIIDLQADEEYTNIRIETTGEFVNKVREEYKKILLDIKTNCFETNYFISNQANRMAQYIKNKYFNEPEFLWDKFKGYGVFRNSNNSKWYAIIMNIDLSKIDKGSGEVEIINVKLDENKISNLIEEKGYYKAYHMNKKDWITIILNDTLADEKIKSLIDESYDFINK